MKLTQASVVALLAQSATARFWEQREVDSVNLYPKGTEAEKYLVEFSPGETRWVTEEEKWSLRRVSWAKDCARKRLTCSQDGRRFMDITETQDLGASAFANKKTAVFPSKPVQQDAVEPLLKKLSKTEMQANLEKFTSFHTRYYKSDSGAESSEWLLQKVTDIIKESDAEDAVFAQPFPHTWKQSSVIATIPGKSNRTVVIGAHQDSINLWLPSVLPAPGADDDGSGTVTILEVFRTILGSDAIRKGEAENTLEFHWYSAEEGGLLGSQAIFKRYESDQRDIKAMLQQDMTGFVQKTIEANRPESVGVIMDYVNPDLTAFIKEVIEEVGFAPLSHVVADEADMSSIATSHGSKQSAATHARTTRRRPRPGIRRRL